MTIAAHSSGLYVMSANNDGDVLFHCGFNESEGNDVLIERGGDRFEGLLAQGSTLTKKKFINTYDECSCLSWKTQGTKSTCIVDAVPDIDSSAFTASVGYSMDASTSMPSQQGLSEVGFYGLFNLELRRTSSSSFNPRLELHHSPRTYTLYNGATYSDYISGNHLYIMLPNMTKDFVYEYTLVYDYPNRTAYAFFNGNLCVSAKVNDGAVPSEKINISHETYVTSCYLTHVTSRLGSHFPLQKIDIPYSI